MTAKPETLPPELDNIPHELRALPRWICWKHHFHKARQKWIKLPIDAKSGRAAKVPEPKSWADFDTASLAFVMGGVDGLGFVFNGDGIVGGDFDKCLDASTGELSANARDALNTVQGYWELSPSGRGLHFITWAILDKAYKSDALGIELYKEGRYFTVTGRVFDEKGQLPATVQDLGPLIAKHFPKKQPASEPAKAPAVIDAAAAGDFFSRVNTAAMENFSAWVPALFPAAREHGDGYRVTSADLGRALEEDLAIHRTGIVDFGVHDMGDEREGKRTPIDLVMEWNAGDKGRDPLDPVTAREAAMWLCARLDTPPEAFGWNKPTVDGDLPGANLPFDRDEDGFIYATAHNLRVALTASEFTGARIGKDTFRDEIMVAKAGTEEWRPFLDADYFALKLALEACGFKVIGRDLMRDAVNFVAGEFKFDSAVTWLNSIQWDGVPRVGGFLANYFGTEDSEYTRSVAMYLWTAMAGRVLEPGCKADMVPILVGLQGAGKTTGVAAMVPSPQHFTEIDLSERDADLARKMRGCLVGEIGELRGLHSRELESIKTFITRTHEKWVAKYKEFAETFPRRLVFVGTTNADEFLADETGNRRWLPVKVSRVDVAGIARDRLQLWAEAAVLWCASGVAYQAAERLGREVHAQHSIRDVWEDSITRWLDGGDALGFGDGEEPRTDKFFSMNEVLVGALGMDIRSVRRADEARVGRVLRQLGYEKRNVRVGEKVQKLWAKSVALCSPSVALLGE